MLAILWHLDLNFLNTSNGKSMEQKYEIAWYVEKAAKNKNGKFRFCIPILSKTDQKTKKESVHFEQLLTCSATSKNLGALEGGGSRFSKSLPKHIRVLSWQTSVLVEFFGSR